MWRGADVAILAVMITSCGDPKQAGRFDFETSSRPHPTFQADSALSFLRAQVEFGPRDPGSQGHAATRDWLIWKLSSYSGNQVFAQDFQVEGYGETLSLTNIIAAFNPSATSRILLCAHWDTRPRAERDPDPANRSRPILGANDGASGVAVLLEMARLFRDHPPPVGVDIVLFDGEDYGYETDLDRYFLGSRHWSAHPPVPGYMPRFGILLDMVGGKDARFPKEGFSVRYARPLVDAIWRLAEEQGHGALFVADKGPPVADDHMILNQVYGLPTVNIIHHPFPETWHTAGDTMDAIDPATLSAVGEVLTRFIYTRIRP